MLRLAADFFGASKKFRPTEILSSFPDLVMLAKMKQAELIIFDKDDTITTLHTFSPASPIIAASLATLRELNISMMVLSNSIK